MQKRIGLILPLDKACYRQILEGVRDGLKRDHPEWQPILFAPGTTKAEEVVAAKLDGIIVVGSAASLEEGEASWGIPTVVFGEGGDASRVGARVDFDYRATGRLAASHLLSTGVDTFVFVGDESQGPEIVARREGFEQHLAEYGFSAQCFSRVEESWLRGIRIPCGVFAADDLLGVELTFACKSIGLRLPHDMTVVSARNDDGVCRLASPTLSSIQFPTGRVGHVLVERLAQLINEEAAAGSSIAFPPLEVCQRGSTQMLAHDDEILVRSLRYIGNHFHEGIGVASIAQQCGVSRRGLERRFSQHLRRTVLEEINRRRVDQARSLLKQGNDTMDRVAELCGFSDSRRLAIHFRRVMGMTPSEYRREVQTVHAS